MNRRAWYAVFVLCFCLLVSVHVFWHFESTFQKHVRELNDQNEYIEVRCAAALALGETKASRAVEPLVAALRDRDVRSAAIPALITIGTPAVQSLIVALEDSNRFVRLSAAMALGQTKDPRAVEPLVALLKDDDVLQLDARDALITIGTPAVQSLIVALEDSNCSVRQVAATALGEIKDPRAVKPLGRVLKDSDCDVRESAATALGQIKDPRAAGSLLGALKDSSPNVRDAAAVALGQVKDRRALGLLLAVFNSESPLRGAAAEALLELKYEPANEQERVALLVAAYRWDEAARLGAPAVEALMDALKGHSSVIRHAAKEALVTIGGPAVDQLSQALQHDNSDVRTAALDALLSIDDQRAAVALVAALPDWDNGPTISAALFRLGWQPQTEREVVYLRICRRDGDALTRDWIQTRRVLLEDMHSGDGARVENAVYTFISLGREDMIAELVRILNDIGDRRMAQTYLNCGHRRLVAAARDWAERHRYTILDFGGSLETSWNAWR